MSHTLCCSLRHSVYRWVIFSLFALPLLGFMDRERRTDDEQPYLTFLERANRFYAERDFEHALRHFLFARELSPDLDNDYRFAFKLGISYYELDRREEALRTLARISADRLAGDFPTFYWAAILAEEDATTDSAIVLFQDLLRRFPRSPFALESRIQLTDLLIRRGRIGEADAVYKIARQDAGLRKYDRIEFEPRLTYQQGKILESVRNYQKALDVYRIVLHEHKYSEEAYRAKSDIERIKRLLQSPVTVDQFLSGNHVLVMQGRYQEALNELAQARANYRESEDQIAIDFQIARIYMMQGLYETAIPRFQTLWNEHQHKEALLQLAKCARYHGDLPLSTQAYRDYLHHVVVSKAWTEYISFEIANNYTAMNDSTSLEEANRIFRQVQASGGYKSYYGYTAHFREGFNLYKLGRYDDAIQKFSEISRVVPALSSRCAYWTAKSHLKAGREDEAQDIFATLAGKKDSDYYGLLSYVRYVAPDKNLHGIFWAPSLSVEEDHSRNGLWAVLHDGFEGASHTNWAADNQIEPAFRRAALASDLVDIDYAERELEPFKKRYLGTLESSLRFKRFAETLGAYTLAVDINSWLRVKFKTRLGTSTEVSRLMYPRYYESEIRTQARAHQLDEHLLFALVKSESAFRASSISSARAMGLMQIMPFTGTALAKELHLDHFRMSHLRNPNTSLWMGSYYLRQQADAYGGYVPAILGAYNAGPHRATFWMRNFRAEEPEEMPEIVELVETGAYIRKIILDRWIYYRLYQS